jgi:uncharacterized membrane protein YfcA
MSLAYTVSGLLVGLLVGLTGVGGGSLMTPLLTLLFGFSPATAVGTDLAFASITKGFGTLAHRAHGHVQWQVVRRLCMGSLPAAVAAILVLKSAGELNAQWLHAIRVTIGVSVLLTVLSLLFRKQMLAWLARNPRFQLEGRAQVVATVLVGAVIGVLVTVSSIGAGAVGATLILLLYPHMKPAEVAGTDIAYAVPLTAVAGWATCGSARSTGICCWRCWWARSPASGSARNVAPHLPDADARGHQARFMAGYE